MYTTKQDLDANLISILLDFMPFVRQELNEIFKIHRRQFVDKEMSRPTIETSRWNGDLPDWEASQ